MWYNLVMRLLQISENEYYHVFNRGVHKNLIFRDHLEYARFLFTLIHFQSSLTFPEVTTLAKIFATKFEITPDLLREMSQKKNVELISFILMPNHFHLILREIAAGGISTYLQRLLNSHSKYCNTKHQTSGHVFQGPYKIVHISDNNQLLYTSAYIHRNCRELRGWAEREQLYQWSSYQDYLTHNRWGDLLNPEIILEQFTNPEEYQYWVENSGAKEKEIELGVVGDIEA